MYTLTQVKYRQTELFKRYIMKRNSVIAIRPHYGLNCPPVPML